MNKFFVCSKCLNVILKTNETSYISYSGKVGKGEPYSHYKWNQKKTGKTYQSWKYENWKILSNWIMLLNHFFLRKEIPAG